jgi:cytochrome c
MSTYKSWFILPLLLVVLTASGADLGLNITPNRGQIVENYIAIISPDGTGLPEGRGTVEEGRALYGTKCASCHGGDGKLPGNLLVGGRGSMSSSQPVKTVGSYWPYATTLFDYIYVAMPYNQEKTMTPSDVYAVTAFVLYMNEIVPPETSLDQTSLPGVQMPNRDGFVELLE